MKREGKRKKSTRENPPAKYGCAVYQFSHGPPVRVAPFFLPFAAASAPDSVAAELDALRPVSALIAIVAAVSLGGRLKQVDDASNMSHDIRLLGGFLVVTIGEKTPVRRWISFNQSS